ncbi:hypothetical protein BGZ76_009754 [Entomortierella beljakovae]|nr:hypothetical protein BGZ76_009754 [Entomortierella beljakovae]
MSAATATTLGPTSHQGYSTGNARPRTRSINSDNSQQSNSYEALASSSTPSSFNQIMSDLSGYQNGLLSPHLSPQRQEFLSSFNTPSPTSSVNSAHHMGTRTSSESNSYTQPTETPQTLANNNGRTSPSNLTSLGANANIEPSGAPPNSNKSHYTSGSIYVNMSGGHTGSGSNHSLLNSNNSLNSLPGNSPLQHRPHTPLKSSFSQSMSDYPSEAVTVNLTPGSLPMTHHPNDRRQETFTFMGVSMKHLSLLVLLLQNSVLVLMMRYSRVSVDPDQPMYLASTAVFLAEIIKLFACCLILVYKTGSIRRTIYIIRKEVIGQPQEILKMLIPSGLYALQNNLLYIALSNLEAATFQVTYQMKILSTAIFSVVMLNRRLSRQKWLSLCLLMIGVTLVQLQNVGTSKSPVIVDSSRNEDDEPDPSEYTLGDHGTKSSDRQDGVSDDDSSLTQNPIIGLLAVLTSCVSSGFAGCYFEKILKGSESDMWVRNLQLGISGSVFSFFAMFYDRHRIYEGGIFQGYSSITWFVITNQALGGLLVAIVVKYADNILKGFATSLSIIVSGMISVYFFDFEPSLQFQLGTMIVILATFLYGRPESIVPRFIRPPKRRQSVPPPMRYA